MKYIIIIITVKVMLALPAFSQYNSPGSVTYDSIYNRWLVTNGDGSIKQRNNATGVVTDFAPPGSGTHAIRIYNGTAYACISTRIKGFSLINGSEVFNVQLTGSSLLYGMSIDNSIGIAYITDFMSRIYKLNLNTQAWWIFVSFASSSPTGIYLDKPRNRLIYCTWLVNAPIRQVNLADSSVSLIRLSGHNYCDGIYADRYDNIYISSWTQSVIFRNDINFTPPGNINVITSGLSNPADIFINKNSDTLGIPNAGNSTVTFHYIGGISGINSVGNTI